MFASRSQFDLFLKPGILGGPVICSYGKVRVAHTLKDPGVLCRDSTKELLITVYSYYFRGTMVSINKKISKMNKYNRALYTVRQRKNG